MKQRFVIDENVIVFADTLTNARDIYDVASFFFVSDMIRNCHALVVDKELKRKHDEKFRELALDSKGKRSPIVIRLITAIQNNRDKYVYVSNTSPYRFEERFPRKDIFLVRIAAASNATLVTLDGGILDAYSKLKSTEHPNFEVMTPKEAVARYFPETIVS